MGKRINIVLPEATIHMIGRMAKPGQRSRFINEAVQHFVEHRSTEAIRAQLQRCVVRDQDLDREVAADWSVVDHHAQHNLQEPKAARKPATRGGEKST